MGRILSLLRGVEQSTRSGWGRWAQEISRSIDALREKDPVDVRDFGVVGGGIVDDTAAMQSAFNASAGRTVLIPAGSYRLSGLSVSINTLISAYGATLDFSAAVVSSVGLRFTDGGGILGATLLGAYAGTYDDAGRAIYASGTQNGAGVAPTYIRGPIVRDCTLQDWGGYGAYIAFCEGAEITKTTITGIGYAGVAGLSCNDCHGDHNVVSDVGGVGAADAYGLFFDRSSGLDEVRTPRSYRCSMSFNTISDIVTANNSQAINTHAGVDIEAIGNTITDCNWGIVYVNSPLGAVPTLAPVRGVIALNTIVRTFAANGAGIMLSGSTIYGGANPEQARGIVVANNTIDGYGYAGSGAIHLQSTDQCKVIGNTLRHSYVSAIHLDEGNSGFDVTGNTIVDPHDSAAAATCVRVHGSYNVGRIAGNVFQFVDAALDTFVAEQAVFVTAGRTGSDVTVGPNEYLGMAVGRLALTTNNDLGVRVDQPNTSIEMNGGTKTLIPGLSSVVQSWRLSSLVADTVITLGETNASVSSHFRVIREDGNALEAVDNGPYDLRVESATALIAVLQMGDWVDVEYDGAEWWLAGRGRLYPFMPNDVDDLLLWLRADVYSLNGSNCSALFDQACVGANRFLQNTAANQPLWADAIYNRHPTVRGVDATDHLAVVTPVDLGTAATIFVVMAQGSTANNWVLVDDAKIAGIGSKFSGNLVQWINDADTLTLANAPAGLHVYAVRQTDGAALDGFMDGVSVAGPVVPAFGLTDIKAILGAADATSGATGLDLPELLAYGRALTDVEIAQISNYLIAWYNI